MQCKTIALLTLLAIMALGGRYTMAHDKTTEIAERVTDRLAIEKLTNELVHFGTERTQQWTLVRIEKSPEP